MLIECAQSKLYAVWGKWAGPSSDRMRIEVRAYAEPVSVRLYAMIHSASGSDLPLAAPLAWRGADWCGSGCVALAVWLCGRSYADC